MVMVRVPVLIRSNGQNTNERILERNDKINGRMSTIIAIYVINDYSKTLSKILKKVLKTHVYNWEF